MSCLLVSAKIVRDIHEDLVYAINMNIFVCYVFQVNIIDLATYLDILCHSRRGYDEVDASSLLIHFEKPCSTWNSVCFQGRRDSETYCLLCSAFVCHHKSCGKRIESSFHTFYASIERLEVNGDVYAILTLHCPRWMSIGMFTLMQKFLPIAEMPSLPEVLFVSTYFNLERCG